MKGCFKRDGKQRGGLLEYFLSKTGQTEAVEGENKEKRTAGMLMMIVTHANNHLLTLSEFVSDKANYHLKMSFQTLWGEKLPPSCSSRSVTVGS